MASKRANATASTRLRQDYMRIKKDPVPYIIGAEPLPSNILEWHYVIKGPENSLYEGGYYHGKLVFPKDFPFKPPKIMMMTPNGRFKTHTRLCLSISDFHPDTWNPAWSVSTILTGLLSFMLEKAPTLGSIETTDYQKKQFALNSLEYNLKDKTFTELFPDICKEIKELLDNQRDQNDPNEGTANNGEFLLPNDLNSENDNFVNGSTFANICVFVGFAVFALVVNYVIKAVTSEDEL
ncbi:ubiquitin-conjugating enzyme E2 J2-like [Clytia hemisphaerica]|uniref:Ubiquitin-conjugating enzyme E2 J2 n=1 Tax=Clytia hemisphaerica TaxID=252671 RepID=A0A7M5WXU3_9CNID|eukprot:TCONS_00059166-protein